MADSVHMTELDEKLSDNTAQLLKAAIPYAKKPQAKALAVAARFLELKKTLDCFKSDADELSVCSVSGKKPSPEELLHDLRKYCDEAQTETIDKLLGMLKMGKLYEKYQELLASPEFSKILNSLGSLNTENVHAPEAIRASGFTRTGPNSAFDADVPQGAAFNPQSMPSPSEMESTLKSMLSPGQLAMFEQLKNSMQRGSE